MIVARAIADMRSPLSDPSRQTAMFAIDILEQRKLGVVIKELPYSSYWARSTRLIRSCSLGSAYQTFALTSLVISAKGKPPPYTTSALDERCLSKSA